MTSTNRDQCPRCSALGSATFSSDVYGAFVRCLTCGYHEDLEDERMVTAMEGWRESLRTEWSLRVDAAIARHSEQNPGCRYLRHHDAADELGLSIRMLSRLLVAAGFRGHGSRSAGPGLCRPRSMGRRYWSLSSLRRNSSRWSVSRVVA